MPKALMELAVPDFPLSAHCGHSLGLPRSGSTMMERAKVWARALKRDVVALWLAARDPRVPWHAKAVAGAVAAYALSPVDLIPDFIPIVGYLDDLLIIPLGILLAVRLIPGPVMADLRAKAIDQRKPTSRAGLVVIVLIWVASIVLVAWLVWPRITGKA